MAILDIKTINNGAPTLFVEQIINGLMEEGHHIDLASVNQRYDLMDRFGTRCGRKIQTIIADEKDLWKPWRLIHFTINKGKRNQFCFAPSVPVRYIQHIHIQWIRGTIYIHVDGKLFYLKSDGLLPGNEFEENVRLIAANEGFHDTDALFDWFNPQRLDFHEFKGKIIHWTDFKY